MQLRFEAAVAGVVPVIRVLVRVARRRARRPRARDRQRHDELHPHRDGRARAPPTRRRWRRPRSSATPRPTRPRTSAAATPPRRWRSSRGWRSAPGSTSTTSTYEGIEHITADDMAYAREFGLGLKLVGTAERIGDGDRRCACTRRSSTRATRSRASAARSTPSRSSRRRSPRSRCPGPAPAGPQTASAVLGDVVSAIVGDRSPRRGRRERGDDRRATSSRPSTCTSRSPTGPACSRRSPSVLGLQGVSMQVGRPAGARRERAPGDGHRTRSLESRFFAALRADLARSTSCAPRRARSACIERRSERTS